MAANPIYAVNGMNVNVLSNSQMVIEPFSFWAWGPIGTPGWGGQLVEFNTTNYPDLTTIGLGGMDANPNGAGNMPPDGAYMLWGFYNPTTNDTKFVTSRQIAISGMPVYPGYTHWRKFSYGVIVKNGKLVENHTAGWPVPTVIFTATESNFLVGTWIATTPGWVAVDLSKLIPEHSRMGIFRATISGNAATIWISPSGSQPNPYFRTLHSGTGVSGQMMMRVDGNEKIFVWVQAAGSTVNLYLDGFVMTEVD